MKAIVLTPGKKDLHLAHRKEPSISADDEIKLRVLQVGVCGTDREEAEGGRARAPKGRRELVIGHETGELLVFRGRGRPHRAGRG